jgi:hypothetical protein
MGDYQMNSIRFVASWMVLGIAGGSLLFAGGRFVGRRYFVYGPRIDLEPPKIDLGTIPVGKSIQFNCALRNLGNEPLLILEIKPSCHCTVVELPERSLPPGKSEEVVIQYTAATPGHRRAEMILQTNDQRTPSSIWRLTANAVAVDSKDSASGAATDGVVQ